MIFVTIFLIIIILLFIGVDLFFYTKTILSRIKIGSYPDEQSWKNAILIRSKKWLLKTPTIKVTDNSRLILLDILKGNYKRQAIQSWQQASLFMGLHEVYKNSQNQEVKVILDKFADSKIASDGQLKFTITEVDDIMPVFALISYLHNNEKYKPAFDAAYRFVLNQLSNNSETVPYRRHVNYYRFVDTIGFICPFLMKYGSVYNVPEAIELAFKQIEAFNRYGMYPDSLLPAHAYREDTKVPVGLFGWGRGLGWYAIGLIDSWLSLKKQHPLKEQLTVQVKNYALFLLESQRENGAWGWYVLEKSSRPDSSAVASLCWFLINASVIPELKERASNAVRLGLEYLKTATRKNGAIDYNQGDTKSIGVYSTHFDILPFTQGFALRTVYSKL